MGGKLEPFSINTARFAFAEESLIGAQVMGFAAAAGRDGVILAERAGGWAQSPADGAVRMTTSMLSNVGSVSKYISGVALLHLLERRKQKTLEQWLDEPFYKYLPVTWRAIAHSTVRQIRIRDLLQHRTGIVGVTEDPFALLEQGVSLADVGMKRVYHNLNFKLLTYLIPAFAGRPLFQQVLDAHASRPGVTRDDVRLWLGRQYHAVMTTMVLPRLPWAIAPSCRVTMDLTRHALAYASKTDGGAGKVWDSWREEEGCRAQGGWYFSARDLVRFTMAAHFTNVLLSDVARSLIWAPGSGRDYMVFSSRTRYPWMRERLGADEVVSHGGSHPFDGSKPQAAVAVLPERTVLAVVTNSPFPTGSAGLRDALVEAYRVSLAA